MKLLRILALAAFLPCAALAGAPMETVQPVDGAGTPLGTPTNPLYVSGGGAATAANQSAEITALQAIQQRAQLFQDYSGQAVAANATLNSTVRDLGTVPAYTSFNLAAYSSVAGTYTIRSCQDAACNTLMGVTSSAVTAGGLVNLSVKVITRYYQLQYVNGATAGAIYANTSFTAN